MLISYLNVIMSQPGSNLARLAHHFQPAVLPFNTRELVETLEELKCVQLYKVVPDHLEEPCSLFSQPPELKQEPVNFLDKAEEIIVEPLADCMLKLANYVTHKSKLFDCPCHVE